ncbi:uncharacterized protein N7511_003744 [Penicillium nucicola]|uniref:uncharacterized protein n=1 Tax=Penicillium nucicola TaxID=1850975 RepID=UPI00254558C4|nr:uncharacterized protein N7511_003744 [Penicillium nucicola]KAJ5766128.1 hypothetical protein N7511_003744 [Penicillium nucicola]
MMSQLLWRDKQHVGSEHSSALSTSQDAEMFGEDFSISQLAVPVVNSLIGFLAYPSQYLFLHFEPLPLTKNEAWAINIFALCIFTCYYRACFVDPGRLSKSEKHSEPTREDGDGLAGRQRWCRRCEAYKPPRAHHCKTCKRCIPKMDHHCPWTSNCVSHFTYPHFIRFLFYAVVGMSYLESCLWQRGYFVWKNSNLPSYLGPRLGQLIHLFILFVVNSVTVFALFILLLRSLWSLGTNTTFIESWEIERHATLVRRSRVLGGYLEGPGGIRVQIRKQEYPYDIGIWSNVKQGMGGSANIISWFWPLARSPDCRSGWEYETNDFEDPDRIPLPVNTRLGSKSSQPYANVQHEIDAFNRRKTEEMKRLTASSVQRRKPFHDRYQRDEFAPSESDDSELESGNETDEGEESWRNAEGERLRDFGVDEEAEFYDEEDIPLGILLQRRQQQTSK